MSNHKVVPDGDLLDPTDPYARQRQTFPKLSVDQLERIKAFGTLEDLPKDTVLFERGDRTVDFFVILKGTIEIYEHHREGQRVITVHGESQFTGEVDLFNDRQILVGGKMGEDGTVIRVKRPDFKRLLSTETDISEIVIRAFILRRVGLISHGQASVTLIDKGKSPDTVRIERFLRRNGYPVEIINCDEAQYKDVQSQYDLKDEDLPSVLIPHGEQLVSKPTNYKLADYLGLTEEIEEGHVYDVVIVGGGPAGLSAAVYAASEGLNTILLEQEAPGGQASTSSKIENYLGFPTGLSGQALAGRAQVQAMKFGAKIILPYGVKDVDCSASPFVMTLCSGAKVIAKSVVVASGARYRALQLENGRDFDNAGIYYAATPMEGEICKNEDVVVVGGGNSAGQAAVFLSQSASHVYMLVRGKSLAASMSDYLINRIQASPKITLHTETEITALNGNKRLESVEWNHKASGNKDVHDIQHVFLMIGAVPHTEWLAECVQLDSRGFICTGVDIVGDKNWPLERPPMMLESSQPGLFAVGDVRSGSVKRVASGVGEGSMSISHVHQYLAELEKLNQDIKKSFIIYWYK